MQLLLAFILSFALIHSSQCVYNGTMASEGQFPFMAYLIVNPNTPSAFVCGGALISSRYVITVAHCTFAGPIEVVVGQNNVTELASNNTYQVVNKTTPVDFGITFDYDDLAVLELDRDVPFVKNVTEYATLALNSPPLGTQLIMVGYGQTSYQRLPFYLHYGNTTVVDDSNCYFDGYTNQTMFCVKDNVTDACFGDSGTPIVFNDNGTYVVVGLDSFGTAGECGTASGIGEVMTLVPALIPFIQNYTTLGSNVTYINVTYVPDLVLNSTNSTNSTSLPDTTEAPTTVAEAELDYEVAELAQMLSERNVHPKVIGLKYQYSHIASNAAYKGHSLVMLTILVGLLCFLTL